MSSEKSEAQTAMATWWLFWATAAAAGATLMAVIVALLSSTADGRRRVREQRTRDTAALRSILAAREYLYGICERRDQSSPDTTERNIWTILGNLSAQRKVAEHYLSQHLTSPKLPGLLADTLQRNYEVRDAVDGLLPKNHGPGWVRQANYTLASAKNRMDENKEVVNSVIRTLKFKA